MGVPMNIFSNTIQHLEQGLDYSSVKQKVISNNIANVETPGYKARKVHFNDVLNQEVQKLKAYRTDHRHFEFSNSNLVPYKITMNRKSSYLSNENSVDIDREMSEMAQNQIYYNTLIDRLNGKFNSLKTVIKGGKV